LRLRWMSLLRRGRWSLGRRGERLGIGVEIGIEVFEPRGLDDVGQ